MCTADGFEMATGRSGPQDDAVFGFVLISGLSNTSAFVFCLIWNIVINKEYRPRVKNRSDRINYLRSNINQLELTGTACRRSVNRAAPSPGTYLTHHFLADVNK